MRSIPVSRWIAVGLSLLALVIPLLTDNSYYLHILISIFIFTIATSGMNVITGYTNQLSLAHAGFFGIGAYAYGLLMTKAGFSFVPALVSAILVTGVLGVAVGIVSLRMKGHHFAIFSLCVGVILLLVIEKWESLTEGVRGLLGIPIPQIGPIQFDTLSSQYYLILFFLLLTAWMNRRIIHSLVGRTFQSIKNSEELAEALGIHVMRNKLLSFVLATMQAGLAGALYAGYIRFIGPDIASVDHTFDMLLYLLVGGMGTLWGPFVGTALVTVVMQFLQSWQEYRMMIFGPLLVLIVMYFPYGIIGTIQRYRLKRKLATEPESSTSGESTKALQSGRMAGGEIDA